MLKLMFVTQPSENESYFGDNNKINFYKAYIRQLFVTKLSSHTVAMLKHFLKWNLQTILLFQLKDLIIRNKKPKTEVRYLKNEGFYGNLKLP